MTFCNMYDNSIFNVLKFIGIIYEIFLTSEWIRKFYALAPAASDPWLYWIHGR